MAPRPAAPPPPHLGVGKEQVGYGFIGKLQGLKYAYRADIRTVLPPDQ